jgi:hypothetical protein
MKTLLILVGSLISIIVNCQKVDYSQDWIKLLENPRYEKFKLKPENYVKKYMSYDFSRLIKPKTEFLGFIGKDYQRIFIYFNSVKKSSDKGIYLVSGTTLVLNNKCNFSGTITIMQIREFKTLNFGADQLYKDSIKTQGLIIGDYRFEEYKNQSHPGEFKGVMSLFWYINRKDELIYDRIELMTSDEYKNNQYVGIWRDYKTNEGKTCNWGEYRIPFSGDLDYGSAEFAPREKYYNKGWHPKK